MGFKNLQVFDDDVVSIENMNCQFYPFDAIGDGKAAALADMVERFTEVKIKANNTRYKSGIFPGIVISAVDSMDARLLIWENHFEKAPWTKAIIDPRMGAESALLYVMRPGTPSDGETYQKSLYGDSEAVQERCTAKATIYTANMLAGLVCKAVKDVLTRKDFLRIAQWNIADDAFQGYRAKVSDPSP